MPRTSWFDEKSDGPLIQEQVSKLESFTSALADGVVTKQELAGQEQRLVAAMKQLEPMLTTNNTPKPRGPSRADGLQHQRPLHERRRSERAWRSNSGRVDQRWVYPSPTAQQPFVEPADDAGGVDAVPASERESSWFSPGKRTITV